MTGPRGRLLVTPRARWLAAHHRLDLTDLRGSGPRGRIVGADVERQVAWRTRQRTLSADSAAGWPGAPARYTLRREVCLPEVVTSPAAATAQAPLCVRLLAAAATAVGEGRRVGVVLDDGHRMVVLAVAAERRVSTIAEATAAWEAVEERRRADRLHPDDLSPVHIAVLDASTWQVDGITSLTTAHVPAVVVLGRPRQIPQMADGVVQSRAVADLTLTTDLRHRTPSSAAALLVRAAEAFEQGDDGRGVGTA